jgi:hypothetical protein
MKEQEENRIKELFLELKQEDKRRAPTFARIMEAALSRSAKTRQPWRILPVAVVTVMLVLVAGSLFIIFKQDSTKTYQTERSELETPNAKSQPPDVIIAVPNKKESPKSGKRRVTRQTRLSPTLISDWRSPTDFLLKTSGEQLLRTTPRLNESITSIKGFSLEEMN